MVMSWRRWCGLCGDIPDPDKDHSDLNDLPVLRDLAIKWFSISVSGKMSLMSGPLLISLPIPGSQKVSRLF